MYDSTRGLRNNNPGNIRRTPDKWRGLSVTQTDSAFFQFTDAKYGIRAMAKLLKNYQTRYGLRTVKDIINRWAPPVENNTSSYVSHVAKVLGVGVTESIDLNNTETLTKLVKAVIKHENGINPYSDATIADSIALI
ncbi:endolysin [Vibrio phage D526]